MLRRQEMNFSTKLKEIELHLDFQDDSHSTCSFGLLGKEENKIAVLYLILLYLMMLLVLVLTNLYVLFVILPNLIENSIFRIPNDNLNKFVDRASVLK